MRDAVKAGDDEMQSTLVALFPVRRLPAGAEGHGQCVLEFETRQSWFLAQQQQQQQRATKQEEDLDWECVTYLK